MKKLTTKTMFGMIFAIPIFSMMILFSMIISLCVSIFVAINKITGTSQAIDWLLFRAKEYSKRMKFRSILSNIDKNTIK